jgi:23S rRNA G2445 N2-methylase RlmL
MIAKNLAPGLQRTFAFQAFSNYDEALWNTLIHEAQAQTFKGNYQLFGYDREEQVLQYARENAERAGVADCISFSQATFPESSRYWEKSVVVSNKEKASPYRILTNPPYGKRLSAEENLFPLYQQLALYLSLEGTYGGIVSSFPELASLLPASRFAHKTRFAGNDSVQFFWKKPL